MSNEAEKEKCIKLPLSRRANKRICFTTPVNAVIRTKDQCFNVLITDISSSGLGFHSKEYIIKGKKVLFELQIDENMELPRKIMAKLKNKYGNTENGHHIYGARFYRMSYWYERNRIHAFIYSELKKQTTD